MRALILLAAAMFGRADDTVLREISRTGVRQKSVQVDAGAFTLAHVERLSRAELRSKPRLNFIQLMIYGDKGGPSLPKPSHLTYDHWLRLQNSSARSPNEIAEMIAVGDNAVLRMREANGKINKRVLGGRDPLQMEVQGGSCEIVYLAFAAPSASIAQRADVFVKTGAELNPEIGLELLNKLQPLFPDMELFVAIRNDGWFVYEPTYPFSNPFLDVPEPLDAEEYAKTKTLKCGRWAGTPSCRFD